MSKTVGFPMIRNFSGDARDFIPDLFAFMDRYDAMFYLEEGYGSRFGYTADDYLKASDKVHFVSRKEAFKQDITMILKNPDERSGDAQRRFRSFFHAALSDPSHAPRDDRTQEPPYILHGCDRG